MFELEKIMPTKNGVIIATVVLTKDPKRRLNCYYKVSKVNIECPKCGKPAVNLDSTLVKFVHGDIDYTVADKLFGVNLSEVNDYVGNNVRGFKDGPLCTSCGLG
jgi:hypothetical protein